LSIPRIYLPQNLEIGNVYTPSDEQARYIKTVLRMRDGEPLLLFNGTGWEYDAVIRHVVNGVGLEITGRHTVIAGTIEITLCQAIPKADKMEAIIRHATELGVSRVIPFFAERSIPRWPAIKSPQKRERWQKISVEASRQCGRVDLPEIGEIASFTEILHSGSPQGLNLICWEEESERGIRTVLQNPIYNRTREFLLLIGPEGGFSKDELDLAQQAGFLSVSLGKRVLRVDTAAVAVIAILQYEMRAMGDAEGESRYGG
jgi:16S rRNA (uracil1498-N3)-methyltransferase